MLNLRLAIAFIITAACAASTPSEPAPDATAVPIDLAGRYHVVSGFSLAAAPPAAANVLDELLAATDGPDDPSRYLIDLMVAQLPEGNLRTYASTLAPYVAAYMNERIASVAPRFVDGARALATGLAGIAIRFGTNETFEVAADGALRRTIVGFRFDLVDVRFEPLGLPDLTALTHATIAGERLAIGPAAVALPYTALLRLGFDRAVIPSVAASARDLAQALHQLVDCPQLGKLVAQWLALGTPDFYARACSAGLTSLAARIYTRIDGIDAASLAFDVGGSARAIDRDANATLDTIAFGSWNGTLAGTEITGGFEGSRE